MTMTDPWTDQEVNVDNGVQPGRLTTVADAQAYVMAGNATVTLVSMTTKTRFTYRIRSTQPDANGRQGPVKFFVSVMTGQDNTSDFKYLGEIRDGPIYNHGRKSKTADTAPSARAFDWFFNNVLMRAEIPDSLQVWHEGRCGACGRKLTVPESIARGLGPECYGRQ